MIKSISFLFFTGVALMGTLSTAHAQDISNAKAAELSLHRVERLVTLKKIEESYQSKFDGLSISALTHQSDTDEAFNSTLREPAALDGTSKRLEILMNHEGKAIRHSVISGGQAAHPFVWPDKDPVTLSENSLHYVLDNAEIDARFQTFNQRLSELSIRSSNDAVTGALLALVEIRAGENDPALLITLRADGTFLSYQIIPRAQ